MAVAEAWVIIPKVKNKGTECELEIMPIVLCKDCKHCYTDGDNVSFNMCALNHNKVQPGDWFCADGRGKDAKG